MDFLELDGVVLKQGAKGVHKLDEIELSEFSLKVSHV